MYFYGLNLGPPGTKFVNDHYAVLHIEFQASKPSGFEEKNVFFLCISMI